MVLKMTRKIFISTIWREDLRGKTTVLDRKLVQALKQAYKHAPSAREIMDRARVKPERSVALNIWSTADYTKADLIELQKSRPPYGGFLSINPDAVERIFITTTYL